MAADEEKSLQHVNGELGEDEALEAAIAMSVAASGRTAPPSSTFGNLNLNRKQMEEERLARQMKRSAGEAGLLRLPPAKRPVTVSSLQIGHGNRPDASAVAGSLAGERSEKNLPFEKGVVRRTWTLGCAREGLDVKIEEILDRNHLELAVLSSFQWDEPWLLSKIDIARTKVILIAFANDKAQQEEMRNNVPSERIRFCFPDMRGGGYMHSKLQLLKFKSHVRIAIPTGNLVPYDWGETGQLDNMVFIIDLPQLQGSSSKVASEKSTETLFKSSLFSFLRAQNLDEGLIQSLNKYDFSETSRFGFIHSISGSHFGPASRATGHCGLGEAVTALGLQTDSPLNVHYLTSSMGSLDNSYLKSLYYACQGDSGMKEYNERQTGKKGQTVARASGRVALRSGQEVQLKDHFKIYFPSADTVAASRGGTNSGGTISFQERWWKASTFPRELVRDSVNDRTGVLMHSKAIYVHAANAAQPAPAWAYIGSANLSESAWGRLVKDRAKGTPKLNCRNWECGVLIPVDRPGSHPIGAKDDLEMFRDAVPVPMEQTKSLPLEERSQPWFFQHHA